MLRYTLMRLGIFVGCLVVVWGLVYSGVVPRGLGDSNGMWIVLLSLADLGPDQLRGAAQGAGPGLGTGRPAGRPDEGQPGGEPQPGGRRGRRGTGARAHLAVVVVA